MVGGCYTPEAPEQCFLSLEGSIDVSKVNKASTMLEMICWDPCSRRKCPLSLCSVPIPHDFGGPAATPRGNFFMMGIMGKFLQRNNRVLKGVIFDGHGTHQYIRRVLHGDVSGLNAEDLRRVPFFGSLTFHPLPPTCLPRLPISVVKSDGEVFWGVPGICILAIS